MTSTAELSMDRLAHRLVADLHTPNARFFWADLLATAAVGWAAFACAVIAEAFSPGQIAAVIVAVFAMYRGLCFVHEITHLRSKVLNGFDTAWNLLFGVPLLIPSFAYVGVHQYHHNPATYGTKEDPEYLPFSTSHRMTAGFALHSLLIPVALAVRFFLMAPLALLIPSFRRWTIRHASSLTMNLEYRRQVTRLLAEQVSYWELVTLGVWLTLGMFGWRYGFLGQALAVWYVVAAFASLTNTLRALGAHRYETDGEPRDRTGQLTDSIDVPGNLFTELWAPVGLRYHALHHYFPGIPYHNLGKAYRRLMAELPSEAPYRTVTSPSLTASLGALYIRGKEASSKVRQLSADRV